MRSVNPETVQTVAWTARGRIAEIKDSGRRCGVRVEVKYGTLTLPWGGFATCKYLIKYVCPQDADQFDRTDGGHLRPKGNNSTRIHKLHILQFWQINSTGMTKYSQHRFSNFKIPT